ncbi:hypothetical protein ACF1FX_31165 [Streptomyces sp. NPDC014646]
MDQLAHAVVLDVSRAMRQGRVPVRSLHDYTADVADALGPG